MNNFQKKIQIAHLAGKHAKKDAVIEFKQSAKKKAQKILLKSAANGFDAIKKEKLMKKLKIPRNFTPLDHFHIKNDIHYYIVEELGLEYLPNTEHGGYYSWTKTK